MNARGGIQMIGCETHLIVFAGKKLELYRVIQSSLIIALCKSVNLGRDCTRDELFTNSISWNKTKSHFVTYHSIDDSGDGDFSAMREIEVWHFDAEADNISLTQTIEPGSDTSFNYVAVGEDFIIGASKDKKIHVWYLHTKGKLSYVLCDVEEDDELADHAIISSSPVLPWTHASDNLTPWLCTLCLGCKERQTIEKI